MPLNKNPNATTSRMWDVIIVGGGMVGGALACCLGRLGMSVAVVERKLAGGFNSENPPDIRVSSLNIASENYLNDMGAWQSILAMRAQSYRRVAVWEKLDGLLAGIVPRDANRTEFTANSIQQSHLGHIVENQVVQLALQELWTSLPNVSCIEGIDLKGLDLFADHAKLTFASGESHCAKLVVGADGAESQVRTLANLGLNSDAYLQHAMVVTVATDGEPADITWQAFTTHGPLAYLPLPKVKNRTYASLVWYDRPEKHQQLKKLSDTGLLEEIRREFPDRLPKLRQLVAKASFPLVKRHAQQYAGERVVLVGDAAHTINPLAGQGVNLGFQDAKVLAEILGDCLQQGEDIGAVHPLKKYEQRRRPANQMMMTAMDGFYYAFSNNIAPVKLFRNVGLGLANRLLPAKKQVLAYALGLK